MKNAVKILCIIFSFICISTSFLSCGCVDNEDERRNEKAMLEYMNKIPRKDNIAYVDEVNNINFRDYSIEAPDNIFRVLYVTSEYVFYFAYTETQYVVYKVGHNGEDKKILLSYEELTSVNMPDENKIFYKVKNGGYYLKNLTDNTTVEITKQQFDNSYYENDYYKVDVDETAIGQIITEYRITSKTTGETKVINEKQRQEILKTEMASKLCEYTELAFTMFVLKDDRIYIGCHGGYEIITVYSYDFETEEIEFFDWYRMDGTLTGSVEKIFVY